jgi:hypothetical protein
MTLGEAREHLGEGVVYRTAYGKTEDGVITSVGDRWVFVRYAGDQRSKATDPVPLEYSIGWSTRTVASRLDTVMVG